MLKRIAHYIHRGVNHLSGKNTDSSYRGLFGIILAIVIIAPLFFIPGINLPIVASKGFILMGLGLVGVIIWLVTILKKGSIVVPNHRFFGVIGLLLLVTLIGNIFTPSFWMSFFGYGFEITTWMFSLLLGLVALFAYFAVRSHKRIAFLYGGVVFIAAIFLVFHIVRFLGDAGFLNLGVLGTSTSTLIGSWSDLGLLFGLVIVIITTSLEMIPLGKGIKWALGAIAGLSLLALIVINIPIITIITGLVLLFSSMYLFSFAYWDREEKVYQKNRSMPWIMLGFFLVTSASLFFAPIVQGFVNKYKNITFADVRPSVSMTSQVAVKSLVYNPITGYGSNTFSTGWNQVKPVVISGTSIGSDEFIAGSGYIPTMMATHGAVGIIGWIVLGLILILFIGITLKRGFTNTLDHCSQVILASGILFLFIAAWVMVPGAYLLVLLFVLIGAYLGRSTALGYIREKTFSFIYDPRASFFGILGVTLLIVVTLWGGYVIIRKSISITSYITANQLIRQGKNTEASQEISRAIALAGHDIYYATQARLFLDQVNMLISQAGNSNKDVLSRQIEQSIGLALGNIQTAIRLSPRTVSHRILEGTIYQTMGTLGIIDAYQKASDAYAAAQRLSPNDTTLQLFDANLALVQNNSKRALEITRESLNKFPTSDGYLLLARLSIISQDWTTAADALSRVLVYNPNNVILAINLGVVYEKAGNITAAEQIFSAIKSKFTDGAQVIDQVKKSFGPTSVPETIAPEPESIDGSNELVAPNEKKQ